MKKIYTAPSISVAHFEAVFTAETVSGQATNSADQANRYLFSESHAARVKTAEIANILKIK